MAEQNVITLMLDDLAQQQPIQTAISIGLNLANDSSDLNIQFSHFNASAFLNLPFQQRYDIALVQLNDSDLLQFSSQQKTQLIVKLRDLWAKRIVICANKADEKLMRALGFQQLFDYQLAEQQCIWLFNILNYKHVPDWLNAKYWANPENWDKYRW
ncbi:DUF6231 family protein [Acinetobacter rudis]|uniref:DUF6231 family protein n=1 Tax=Acinetobacter rudis TaxID=632955 RepID=A0AAW8J852_9GAMM|nr:DUF6231 family protein [Acinetobacter rudis]MDQ8936331.1 DUF6231 family protein [Acinetobacter rudis]MDQ8953445.1 DUF6231 family protein [Acinetobacter rudis]MDQ9018592.1 DUF6231 family protein [Acinetobacter rudis]